MKYVLLLLLASLSTSSAVEPGRTREERLRAEIAAEEARLETAEGNIALGTIAHLHSLRRELDPNYGWKSRLASNVAVWGTIVGLSIFILAKQQAK